MFNLTSGNVGCVVIENYSDIITVN